jgi:hypothetical protein
MWVHSGVLPWRKWMVDDRNDVIALHRLVADPAPQVEWVQLVHQ